MKKSLLALAVLGAFAGAASAQSSVTMYGLIDLNLGKDIGSAAKRMSQGASSRLGWRGVEDLGGGLKAIFQLENRFRGWNGTINGGNGVNGSPVTLFQAASWVGLQGGFGTVRIGRWYDAAFFTGELIGDPWGFDTVAANTGVMMGSAINHLNTNRSVTYNSPSFGGFEMHAQMGETNDNCGASGLNSTAVPGGIVGTPVYGTCPKRPYSFGAKFGGGPFGVGFGYHNPGNVNDKWMSFNAQYNLGFMKLWGFIGSGKNTANASVKTSMFAITAPVGAGEIRASVSKAKTGSTSTLSGLGLGYHHALSKRTTLYTDFARNGKASTQKTGYDFGVKHTF